jgi:hypothetical protein
MPKFLIKETIPTEAKSMRLGASATATDRLKDADVGKFVKLVAESQYDLAEAGDAIEAYVTSLETSTVDGFAFGGICNTVGAYKEVTFDDTAAIGDYVEVGVVSARGTPLAGPPHVQVADSATVPFAWRVVSLGAAGTGAAGTIGVIERVA